MASYRVIADSGLKHIPTVNIVTAVGSHAKNATQLTAAAAKVGTHKTVQVSASLTKGLPTFCILGYSGPD